ncbi:MAG: NADH-quinone oxidoreductase subunit L [Actinomycetota bacterium]|nr:NADH-quinone oxidoreductase subunit L [Actinomycetota bacterium]
MIPSVFADNAWLVFVVPVVVAALVGVLGSRMKASAPWIAMVSPVLVMVYGVGGMARILSEGTPKPFMESSVFADSVAWIPAGESALHVGWAFDGLTCVMLTVVGLVALMVMIFSIGYMHGEDGLPRYFALLSLFTGAMTLLVVADGLVGLFVGWELVGACSYLLIGFWFHKPSAAAAAVKAFLTTRVGDVGLLLGLALLWRETGALSYEAVFANIDMLTPTLVTAVAVLLFIGAAGKSAQFPLHIWLPDAMEGPTPVSALIHAATMVAAGVFLVARTWPVFEASEPARMIVLAIGAFTALGAATIAVAQTDIKKVLAYSTISQLGFMFAALGAGAWVAAVFHLVTHAGFKALLFLGSGSVIHGSGTQDMRQMGGLAKKMPVTAATWVAGSAALAGVPLLSGFFSKDEVLHAVWSSNTIAGAALFAASALTAFYITRATRLTFFGEYRGDGHPHEGGWQMRLPLIVLAVPAVAAGFLGGNIAKLLGEHGEALDPVTAAISGTIALVSIAFAWYVFRGGAISDIDLEERMSSLWTVLRNGYGYDGFVGRTIVEPTQRVSGALYRAVDRVVVDGVAEGVGGLARSVGRVLTLLQNGDGQWYAALLGAGAAMLVALMYWVGR